MSVPFYRTRKFKRLQRTWKAKLAASGFKDIEGSHHGTPIDDLGQRIHFKPGIKELTDAYFSWAANQVHHAKFHSARHRKIWKAHASGLSAAAIGREVGLSRWRISDILTEIKSYLAPRKIEKKEAA